MKFVSTRSPENKVSFVEAALQGLAPDGGLYVPENWPSVDQDTVTQWRKLSFEQLFYEIVKLFLGEEIPHECLLSIIHESLLQFRDPECVKVRKFTDRVGLLELFHGPTYAFKDVALQFLARLLGYILQTADQRMTMLGATSGDTGSAAIAGFKSRTNIGCVVLFPHNKVSDLQRRQMTTVSDSNIHCVAVKGTFDDCQRLVKQAFTNKSINGSRLRLGAINSINFARICAQIVYYYYGVMKFQNLVGLGEDEPVDVCVPTGNFGNILAGYYAKKLGCPIGKLLIASNSNNILTRFWHTGTYKPSTVIPTMSPSMDIQLSSNLERYLFEILNRNSNGIIKLFDDLQAKGEFSLSQQELKQFHRDFAAYSVDESETLSTIDAFHRQHQYILDPHSAVGVNAGFQHMKVALENPILFLSTAHYSKFIPSIEKVIPREILDEGYPDELKQLETRVERFQVLEADNSELKQFLSQFYCSDT